MKKNFAILATVIILISASAEVSAIDYVADASISVSEMYNDNIYLTRSNKVSDFITVVNPAFALSTRSKDADVMINYSPTFNIYSEHDDRTNISHQAAVSGHYKLSDTLTLGLSDAYIQSQESSILRTIEGGGPIINDQRIITNNVLNVDLAYRLSGLFNVQAAATHTLVNTAGTDDGDYMTYAGRLGINYILDERITLRVNSIFTFYDYKISGDAKSMDYTLGANWRITPTVTLDGYGGMVITRLEQEGRTVSGVSGGLSLAKRFERGTASITYAHGVTAGIQSATPLESDVFTLRYTMPVTERMDASLSAFYGAYRSLGDTRGIYTTEGIYTANRDEYGGALSLIYRLWERLSATLSYSYVKSNARSTAGESYNNNIIMIGLRYLYQARF